MGEDQPCWCWLSVEMKKAKEPYGEIAFTAGQKYICIGMDRFDNLIIINNSGVRHLIPRKDFDRWFSWNPPNS